MKAFGIFAAVSLALLVALILAIGVTFVHYTNKEATLRTAAEAQAKANEASFDTMWKIIQQKGQVSDSYKDAFAKIYPELIAGRYGKGELVKFVTESNPKFEIKLFASVMNSVEAERKRFLADQKKLIDLKREHDQLRRTFPGSLIVGGTPPLDIKVVTSDETDDAFRTGKEKPADLNKK